jgi:hypothetical protein
MVEKDFIEVTKEFGEFIAKINDDVLRKMAENMDKKVSEILKRGETK